MEIRVVYHRTAFEATRPIRVFIRKKYGVLRFIIYR